MSFQAEFERDQDHVETLFLSLGRAEDLLSRLDERVRSCGFPEGWSNRADVRAVVGAMAAEGLSVHPEDLILHDLGADARLPAATVARARQVLQARRRAAAGGGEILSWAGVAWMSGQSRRAPPLGQRPTTVIPGAQRTHLGYVGLAAFVSGLAKGEAETGRPGVEECLGVFDLSDLPPLLLAAAFMEAWRLVDPLPRHRPLGGLLASQFLKASGRFTAGLFPLEVARARRPMPGRLAWAGPAERLTYWLGIYEVAARLELEELVRLGHQKALVDRRAGGGRRSSRAPALAALAVTSPVITTDLVVSALGITPQASLQLIAKFGNVLHEITGRTRYRVWRL